MSPMAYTPAPILRTRVGGVRDIEVSTIDLRHSTSRRGHRFETCVFDGDDAFQGGRFDARYVSRDDAIASHYEICDQVLAELGKS